MIRLTGPPARERNESVDAQTRFIEGVSRPNTEVSTATWVGMPRVSTPTRLFSGDAAVSMRP